MAGDSSSSDDLHALLVQLGHELRDVRIVINVVCGLIEFRGGPVKRAELGKILEDIHRQTAPVEKGFWLDQLARDLQRGEIIRGDESGRPYWLRDIIEGGAKPSSGGDK